MPGLVWTPAALQDVRRLHDFLANTNADAARRAVAAIRRGVRVLQDQPGLGRRYPDRPREFREWLIPFGRAGYLLLYRFDEDEVVILAVRHMREAGY